jgi:hypothetical protein
MVIYWPCWWDDWGNEFVTLPHIESWMNSPAFCEYGHNGREYWMTLGRPTYFDGGFCENTMPNPYQEARLAREIRQFVAVKSTSEV